jgi:hypothetical protein
MVSYTHASLSGTGYYDPFELSKMSVALRARQAINSILIWARPPEANGTLAETMKQLLREIDHNPLLWALAFVPITWLFRIGLLADGEA